MGVRLSVRPRERVEGDEDNDARYELDQDRIVIGRGAGADVRLPHPSVSTRHATIEQRAGRYVIVDHSSTNGTFVQGVRLVPERAKSLRDGDRIDVGTFSIEWKEGVAVAQSPTAERTRSLARRLLRDVLGSKAPTGPRLIILDGPGRDRVFELPPAPSSILVGRGDTCELQIDDFDASREHVAIVVDLDGVIVRDLRSKNGLFVNDRPVHEKRLADRDELLIGSTRLAFDDATDGALRAAESEADAVIAAPAEPAAPPPAPTPADDPEAPTGEPDPPARTPSVPSAAPPSLPPTPRPAIGQAELAIYLLAALVFLASVGGLFWILRAS